MEGGGEECLVEFASLLKFSGMSVSVVCLGCGGLEKIAEEHQWQLSVVNSASQLCQVMKSTEV